MFSLGKNGQEVKEQKSSRWQRRTAKRRQQTEQLLNFIEDDGLPFLPLLSTPDVISASKVHDNIDNVDVPTLEIASPSSIDWDTIHPELDPIQGGKIRQDTKRGFRKRAQVEAFYFIVSSLLDTRKAKDESSTRKGVTIIDAGCGAGNLAIALTGLLLSNNCVNHYNANVLAVDVNNQALERLSHRAQSILPPETFQTCCADLANYEYIQSKIPSHHDVIVVSLHACGAASDMAMNLAFQCHNAPFIICPCCTAKSLTKRVDAVKTKTPVEKRVAVLDPSASFQRSGATADIDYPRSDWLRNKLLSKTTPNDMADMDGQYTLLAKVADVGLGPQTPSQQREHQRRAKKIVELDRVMAASESHGYDVRLMRMPDHDPLEYGKGELLLGGVKGSTAAKVLMNLPAAAS